MLAPVNFSKWILEVKRQMYEDGCHHEAIGMLDAFPEWWEDKFNEGLTWQEVLQEAIDDAIGCD